MAAHPRSEEAILVPEALTVRPLEHPAWVSRLNRFGDIVGDPRALVDLDPDRLLAVARSTTGLHDLGEDDWPGWTETYERQLAAIDAEADLHLLGRVLTRSEVLRVLQTWLRLQDLWRREPQILRIPVEEPLFVVGPPRTGTTILLELLALGAPAACLVLLYKIEQSALVTLVSARARSPK